MPGREIKGVSLKGLPSIEPEHMAELGAFVKKRREELGFTNVQLGRLANYDWHTINALEFGRYNPTRKGILRLAKALKVELDELAPEEYRNESFNNWLQKEKESHKNVA